MSRWRRWSNSEEKLGFSTFKESTLGDLGNPSAAAGGPAERARQLGLQSNGKGGYIDPNTGQVVARTVNGELVFYDTNSPDGGAVSDGAGGRNLVQSQPSWADPLTGMLTTPPANAESPAEIAAIPDPTPATAPAGYSSFMKKKKDAAYQLNKEQPQPARLTPDEAEEQEAQAQQGDPAQQQAFSAEATTYRMFEAQGPGGDAAKRMAAAFERNQQRIQRDSESAWEKAAKARESGTPGQIGTTPEELSKAANPTSDLRRDQLRSSGRALASTPPQAPQLSKQQIQQIDTNNDGQVDQEELRKAALEAYQSWQTPRISAERRMETKFAPLMEALSGENVNPQLRSRLMQTMLGSMRYEGRDNEASSDLSKSEFQSLQENRQRIMNGYGGEGSDGSSHNFDAIRQFQRDMSDPDLDEELLKKAFDALPPDRQKIFKGGDMSAWQGFKKFAAQRGKGGYTGLDLDMNTMQMEHFIDNSQSQRIKELIKKENREMTPEEKELIEFIASEDNQFWSRQSPNEQKSARNIQDFYGQRVDPLDELGEDFFDFREMQLDPARLNLKGQEKGYIQNMIDTDEDGFISLQEMDEAGFDSHLNVVNQIYDNQKRDLLEALSQRFDTKSLLKMGPKAFEKAIADENSDVSEEDRSRYDMLRNLQSKVKGYNSSFEKRIAQALGLSTGFIQSERARTNGASPEIYKAAIRSLVGKNKDEQKEQLDKIKRVFANANSTANKQRGQGNTDADIKRVMYQTLLQGGMNEGIFSDEMFENSPGLAKLRDKFLSQLEGMEEMLGDDEDMGFEMEDILEIIKQMMDNEGGEGKKTLEDFKSQG
jgi:hypothetical protein